MAWETATDVDGSYSFHPKHPPFVPFRAYDWETNRYRLDTLTNMLNNPQVGLIFMIPGMNETLRVNGQVRLVRDADLLASLAFEGKRPKLAIVVDIEEVFSHCPKAFMRSKLWSVESQIDRRELPSFAEILRDHAAPGECDLDELQRGIDRRVASTLH